MELYPLAGRRAVGLVGGPDLGVRPPQGVGTLAKALPLSPWCWCGASRDAAQASSRNRQRLQLWQGQGHCWAVCVCVCMCICVFPCWALATGRRGARRWACWLAGWYMHVGRDVCAVCVHRGLCAGEDLVVCTHTHTESVVQYSFLELFEGRELVRMCVCVHALGELVSRTEAARPRCVRHAQGE